MRYFPVIFFLQAESGPQRQLSLCQFECQQVQDVATCLEGCVDCKADCNEQHKKELEYCHELSGHIEQNQCKNEANDRHMACASDCHCQEQCETRYINEQVKCEHIHDENLIPLCYENAWELFENCMLGNCDIKVTTTVTPSSTLTTGITATTMVSSTTTVTAITSTSTDQPEGSSDFDY